MLYAFIGHLLFEHPFHMVACKAQRECQAAVKKIEPMPRDRHKGKKKPPLLLEKAVKVPVQSENE